MKVSVALITYNHEPYIARAIESVLRQEVAGNYELVIGEDFSSDQTRDVVIQYKKRYPEKIKLHLQETHRGDLGKTNYLQTLSACAGEYIACMDGDDYWTEPHKLQRQAAFLDEHPEYSACVHNMELLSADRSSRRLNMFPKREYTFEDILKGVHLARSSAMFRNGLADGFPSWYFDERLVNGDVLHFMLYARHGKIGYLNEVMGVYRVHPGGVWSSLEKIEQIKQNMDTRRVMNSGFNYEYDALTRRYLRKHYMLLGLLYLVKGELRLSVRSFGRMLRRGTVRER